jgi:hypothetical protein
MTARDIFLRIIGALDQAGIPYMLTGSFAGSYHGAPRATQDIDIVVAPDPDQLQAFIRQLPATEYFADEEEALHALRDRALFNVVDFVTGWKIDLIIRKARPFSLTEFGRRQAVDFLGLRLYIASAEDVVLAKLEWAKRGGSRRQIEDAAGILRVQAAHLDGAYLSHWVHELGLAGEWDAAAAAAGTDPAL